MLTASEQNEEEQENYFISMTDMMVGMLFVFIILLMVFAVNFKIGDDDSKRIKDCLADLIRRNAQMSADIDKNVNRIQDEVRGQIEALELAADQRRRLLTDIRTGLSERGVEVEVAEQNGVIRLTEARRSEAAIRFASNRSDLDTKAQETATKIADVLASVVPRYAACRAPQTENCRLANGAVLETIFVEGHTDASGPAERNWILSTERATATYRAIISQAPQLVEFRNRRGEEIISISGYSSTRPIAPGSLRDSLDRNRRIDLRFVMDADTTINLRDIIALNDEVKRQIARLATVSQQSVNACT